MPSYFRNLFRHVKVKARTRVNILKSENNFVSVTVLAGAKCHYCKHVCQVVSILLLGMEQIQLRKTLRRKKPGTVIILIYLIKLKVKDTNLENDKIS